MLRVCGVVHLQARKLRQREGQEVSLDTFPAGQPGACWFQRPRDQFRGTEGIWGHHMADGCGWGSGKLG